MTEYKYICSHHRNWVDAKPKEAFDTVLKVQKLAEQLMQKHQYRKAIPFLGTSLETLEIIFDKRLESPQLTTTLTSVAVMLAHAYVQTDNPSRANKLLSRLQIKMQCAITCATGYATKVAFFQHCFRALAEASADILGYEKECLIPANTQLH